MKKEKVIVTGGVGFIGSHLCAALVEAGKQVISIDIRKVKTRKKIDGVQYLQMDIRSQECIDFLIKTRAAAVYHLAAHIDNLASVADPAMDASHNITGTLNILQGVREAGTGKIIFASSCAVYGNQEELPVKETAELHLGSPYGLSKRTCEQYMDLYYKYHGVPYIALRKANVYGPGQDGSRESGVITVFTTNMVSGKPVFIYNDGESTRDYVHVTDVVDAYLKAAEADYVGVINIGTGEQTSTKEVFDVVSSAAGVKLPKEFKEEIEDAIRYSAIDPSKAEEILGWKKTIEFEEGVERTVEWYRANV